MLKPQLKQFVLISAALAVTACSGQGKTSSQARDVDFDLLKDIETICAEVPVKYVYFNEREGHWSQSCERARAEANLLEGRQGALAVVERLLDDLYDPPVTLNTNNQQSPRLVPSGSDLWFDQQGANYIVSAVRPGSGAAKAGLLIGDELVRFNGLAPDELALTRMHSGVDDPSRVRMIWAVNSAIAGRRSEHRRIEVKRGEETLSFSMTEPDVTRPDTLVSHRTLPENLGYIRINNSLGNDGTVAAFNSALNELMETDGLILDIRATPGGGNTGVAEPIMGRFIDTRTSYQRTIYPDGKQTDRRVKPSRSAQYTAPVVILVGRWTGSMGEGMAIGFDGMGRATVMGSQMAGLAGGTHPLKLNQLGASVWLPMYDLQHLDGTPRHIWELPVSEVADNGDDEDVLLKKARLVLLPK